MFAHDFAAAAAAASICLELYKKKSDFFFCGESRFDDVFADVLLIQVAPAPGNRFIMFVVGKHF